MVTDVKRCQFFPVHLNEARGGKLMFDEVYQGLLDIQLVLLMKAAAAAM